MSARGLCALLVAAVLAAPIHLGCEGKSCTEMDCSDGASIVVKAASAALPEGSYVITLSLDGTEVVSCTAELPDRQSTCGGTIDAAGIRFDLGTGMESFHARVEVDGVVVADEDIQTSFVEWYPNGPDCDDDPCLQGTATVVVSDP